MKIDYTVISIIIGVLVVLASIFLNEYVSDIEIPLIVLALGFMVYAYYKDKVNERKGN